jgi:tRNA threonylcarbamoyladenosine biosynthesis protein TsaE
MTHSPEETQKIGKIVGSVAQQGSVIELTGDLGAGKTCFVQGIAQGLGTPDDCYITSPTYSIINEYPGRLDLFHADLYRISDPFELEMIGFYEKYEKEGVMAIEWPDRLESAVSNDHLHITIKPTDENSREIIFFFNGQKWENLVLLPVKYKHSDKKK